MNAQELRGMEEAALKAEIATKQRSLIDLRCQVAQGEDVRPHQIAESRREIARIKTILRERELKAAGGKK